MADPYFKLDKLAPDEEFRPLIYPEIKPIYKVSNYGRILSTKRNRIMSYKVDKDGYRRVGLWRTNGRSKTDIGIHRLVAWTFCDWYDESEGRTIPNHKDSDPSNNKSTNLEWVTSSENAKHGYRYGNKTTRYGEKSNFATHTEAEIRLVLELLECGYDSNIVSIISGIPKSYVSSICAGRSWRHLRREYQIPKEYRVRIVGEVSEETKYQMKKLYDEGFALTEISELLNIKMRYYIRNTKILNNEFKIY